METAIQEQQDNGQAEEAPEKQKGPRPFADILHDLQKEIPQRLLKSKTLKGNKITFIPWYRAQQLLNHYTNGFNSYEVRERVVTDSRIMMSVRVTIHAQEGDFFKDGTGIEDSEVSGWGDEQSNAESMAFRRACARFGLGIKLYEG